MSKKKVKNEKNQKQGGIINLEIENKIPSKYKTLGLVLIVFLLMGVFFAPAFWGNKTFQSGDIMSQNAYKTFFSEYSLRLWDPFIFCGMPAIGNAGIYDLIGTAVGYIIKAYGFVFKNNYAVHSIYLLLLGLGSYLLMRHLKGSFLTSIFAAVSTVFSVGVISLLFIGHINKLSTLAILPVIILMLLRMQEKIKTLDVLILFLALKFMFSQWHVQIIFYIVFTIGIYFIYYIVRAILDKERELLKRLLIGAMLTMFAGGLGFASHYTTLGQMYEYSPYSTRGEKSVLDLTSGSSQKSDDDYYQYSTNWSFSPGEVMTFIFPAYYGFGNSTYKGPLTNNQEYEMNTYFGQMPFTDAALYMGIIVFGLAIFAIIKRRKEPFVQFLTILIVISLFISFGRTFPILFDIFFYNVPFFDKFRAPVMILNIVQIAFPILAGLGLTKAVEMKKNPKQKDENLLRNLGFVFSALFVVALFLNGAISDWFIGRAAESGKFAQYGLKGEGLDMLHKYAADMFMSDLYVSFALLAVLFFGMYLYLRNRISFDFFVLCLLILSFIDLYRVDKRALHFREAQDINILFREPDYVTAIKARKDKDPFRIFSVKQDGSLGSVRQNSNYHVYFLLEDFYGYSGLKPRSFQDFADVVLTTNLLNPTLLRMANVKYIIADKQIAAEGFKPVFAGSSGIVYLNENALPRAFFVDSIAVKTPIDFLNAVKNNEFDPKQAAYSAEDYKLQIDNPGDSAYLKFVEYEPMYIKMEANATGNNLLFMSSTYYPKGWKARIDGADVKIYKLNHQYKGVVVPNGTHTVEFIYMPDTFVKGRLAALGINIAVIILFSIVIIKRKRDGKGLTIKSE